MVGSWIRRREIVAMVRMLVYYSAEVSNGSNIPLLEKGETLNVSPAEGEEKGVGVSLDHFKDQ